MPSVIFMPTVRRLVSAVSCSSGTASFSKATNKVDEMPCGSAASAADTISHAGRRCSGNRGVSAGNRNTKRKPNEGRKIALIVLVNLLRQRMLSVVDPNRTMNGSEVIQPKSAGVAPSRMAYTDRKRLVAASANPYQVTSRTRCRKFARSMSLVILSSLSQTLYKQHGPQGCDPQNVFVYCF